MHKLPNEATDIPPPQNSIPPDLSSNASQFYTITGQEPITQPSADSHADGYALTEHKRLDPTHATQSDTVDFQRARNDQAQFYSPGQQSPPVGFQTYFQNPRNEAQYNGIAHPRTRAYDQAMRAANLLAMAFSISSLYPDPLRRECLNLVMAAPFLFRNELEPALYSLDGFLAMGPAAIDPPHRTLPGSIFHIFLDTLGRTCLICGATKRTLARAVGCVRSHLNHRPFTCPGTDGGCTRCVSGREKGFYTAALLDDHIKGQAWRYACPHPDCPAVLRRGGQKRHWETIHKGEPFPF